MLFLRNGGSWTQLGSTYNSGRAAGRDASCRCPRWASTISFLENGVAKITVTDTNLTGGAPGIMAYGNPDADNWSGGERGLGHDVLGGRVGLRAVRDGGAAGQWR